MTTTTHYHHYHCRLAALDIGHGRMEPVVVVAMSSTRRVTSALSAST